MLPQNVSIYIQVKIKWQSFVLSKKFMQLAEHNANIFMTVQGYFIVYCGCREVVKLLRLLL
jgi:hypothetical protein